MQGVHVVPLEVARLADVVVTAALAAVSSGVLAAHLAAGHPSRLKAVDASRERGRPGHSRRQVR